MTKNDIGTIILNWLKGFFTKNLALKIVSLLFAILLYFFENNTGTRTILAASVFLPAASVLCAVRSARRVTVHLSAPDCCKQGDAAKARCMIAALPCAATGTIYSET